MKTSDNSDLENYIQIDFINCHGDYSYTVCPYSDIKTQLQICESNFLDYDPSEDEELGKPEIKITPVQMTVKEFEDLQASWFLT